MTVKTILVVEDERMIAEDIVESLSELGYHVPALAASGEEALEKVTEHKPDLVLMDIMLKGNWDGIQTAQEIHKIHDCALIYLTAFTDRDVLQRAKITTPFGYILKPFREKELHAMVEVSLYRHAAERQNQERQNMILSTLAHSKEVLFVTDQEGQISFMNHEAEHLLGFPLSDAKQRPLTEHLRMTESESGPDLPLLQAYTHQTVRLHTPQHEIPARIIVSPMNQSNVQGFIFSILPLPVPNADTETSAALIPICASCKNIRSSDGLYIAMEQFFREHYDFHFSHGICPGCFEHLYPDYFK